VNQFKKTIKPLKREVYILDGVTLRAKKKRLEERGRPSKASAEVNLSFGTRQKRLSETRDACGGRKRSMIKKRKGEEEGRGRKKRGKASQSQLSECYQIRLETQETGDF